MTEIQRIRNDIATMDKRNMTDKAVEDNRAKNDELTGKRRHKADRKEDADKAMKDSRVKNDELTEVKRHKTDKTIEKNRLRNDELTVSRRDIKDGKPSLTLATYVLTLMVLAAGVFAIFI